MTLHNNREGPTPPLCTPRIITHTMDDQMVIVLGLFLFISLYHEACEPQPRRRYIASVEYNSFEFTLDSVEEERQRRLMR